MSPIDPDEGPTEADLERFSRDTGYCPDCGAEVFDQADICPACYAYLGGDVARRPPFQQWYRRRWTAMVIVAILVAFLLIVFR